MRSSTAVAVAACVAALSSCRDGATAPPDLQVQPAFAAAAAPAPSVDYVTCTGNTRYVSVTCAASTAAYAPPVSSADGTISFGSQQKLVTLAPSNVTYSGGVLSFDLAVLSFIGQRLGTVDGTTADSRGIRVFLNAPPVVTRGIGSVRSGAGDGTANFSGSAQTYYRYATMLDSAQRSGTRRWSFSAPSSVRRFTFSLAVNAPVRHANGWVTVTPSTASVAAGSSVSLAAAIRDAAGRSVAGNARWSSANTAIATVDSTGRVTGRSAGSARITAASGSSAAGASTVTVTGSASPPPDTTPVPVPPADVTFTVNTASRFPISRYIYGMNFTEGTAGTTNSYGGVTPPAEVTLNRFGGNRLSAYNWENNFSNAGSDYQYNNDAYLSASRTPGEAVRSRAAATFAKGSAMLVTIPMLGYVSADGNGPVTNTDADRATRLATRFVVSKPAKGAAFALTPSPTDGAVYQDEFVNWLESTFPQARTDSTRTIFYSLDNEPDLWHSTHREINNAPQTYDGFTATTIAYARAIKAVAPAAKVFGPAVATYTGVVTLGRYPSPDPVYGTQNFFDVYLDKLRAAEGTAGRRLVDVLDLHWYPAAGAGGNEIGNDNAAQDAAMINARLQAPRSLWDPTYNENSWVSGVTGGPIRLIPRLRDQIAAHYPGTKLAITEYYYGRGGDVSGGIAQADVLGIFGREGMYAATLWPNAALGAYGNSGARAYAYAFGAFKAFLNYDGNGGRFGDTGVSASTSDVVNSSVYASLDAQGRVVIVAINKNSAAKTVAIRVSHPVALSKASVYRIDGTTSVPTRAADLAVGANNVLVYSMPAYSVSTLVLTP